MRPRDGLYGGALALGALFASSLSARAASMSGAYGPYPLSREASGTSWQPDSTPHEGIHVMQDGWMLMVHGAAYGVYDDQRGPRGDHKTFAEGMLMARAQRSAGEGMLGLRAMLSLDPAMGADGYPLLLQTGETADGRTPLVDRQHPHDFFSELAASYSLPLDDETSVFAYFGLPGEPALGPPAFLHRFSGMDDPQAPIAHHWLDSTHVAFGAATLGFVQGSWKLEGSVFKGREPDEHRWDMDSPAFDSFSARLSYNPDENEAFQASYGHLVSPEQLEPSVNQGRLTASAIHNWRLGDAPAQTTLAFGQDRNRPGRNLNAFLLEAAARVAGGHTVFARAERVDKDELFTSGPLAGQALTVNEISLGYIYDFTIWGRTEWGLGEVTSVSIVPKAAAGAYGGSPKSFMLFARVKIV